MEKEIPFHKSLLQPNLIFGVPATLFYIMVLGAFYIGLAFSFKYALFILPVFIIVRMICKSDPDYLTILFDCILEPDHLEG